MMNSSPRLICSINSLTYGTCVLRVPPAVIGSRFGRERLFEFSTAFCLVHRPHHRTFITEDNFPDSLSSQTALASQVFSRTHFTRILRLRDDRRTYTYRLRS